MNKSSPPDYQLARGGSKPLKLEVRVWSGEAHGQGAVEMTPKSAPRGAVSAAF